MLAAFEEALAVLDEEGLEAHQDDWMPTVRASLDSLVQAYQQLTQADREPIDYSAIQTQAAYLYAYAMPRAFFTFEMLRRHRGAIGAPLFAPGEIAVISFGGGPASELVGLLAYLDDATHGEAVTAITYRVFDKDSEWRDAALAVAAAIETPIELRVSYEVLDLADTENCAGVDVSTADLVIFSYIMSELCSLETADVIAQNLRNMLPAMKSGAAMLFIDSKHPQFIQFFQACRQFIGRQKNDDGDGVDLPLPAFMPTFQAYRDALDRNPRMDATIVSKWLVKP